MQDYMGSSAKRNRLSDIQDILVTAVVIWATSTVQMSATASEVHRQMTLPEFSSKIK